ncbi:hypothetical protein [Halotia branconii]|uniref:Uncharacterized protein n=1 Tax=Halotia branconii CENA392 TaxID=1539056 RepID=A0AAJ6NZ17_9CYAN|nr:hypothetical protein [Halotia branconii]WGV29109.1 hypothetical protein QI031_30355 [Halotia branconii CENA392]
MGSIKKGTIAEVNYGRYSTKSVLIIEDRDDIPLAGIFNSESNYSVMFISGEKAIIHGHDLKPLVTCPLLVADIDHFKRD